jgi:hypothetical protein
MNLTISEQDERRVECRRGDALLFHYHHAPQMPQLESPRPYFHPLRTLRGNLVTGFRPHDHVWHKGLSLTCAELSGENFWGGVTWVRGQGYRQLKNNGTQRHVRWKVLSTGVERATLGQQLQWHTEAGQTWLEEERLLEIDTSGAAEGYWTLTCTFHLHNVSGRELVWGSPTTAGRPDAGYGGLFWRGPRDFQGGRILISEGRDGPESMGRRSPWLAYLGKHDETSHETTMLFLDARHNPRHPTKWFVRNSVTMVAFAWTFDELYTQPHDETLKLTHRVVIADGAWTRERIEKFAAQHLPAG